MPSLYGVVFLSAELSGHFNLFLTRAHKYGFQIKSTQLRRLLRKPIRSCSSKCNVSSTVSTPLYLLLNPTLTAFVSGDIPMSSQNVHFSSAKIRALSGVYTDTYDDGEALHCFMFLDLCDCTHCAKMHVHLLHVLFIYLLFARNHQCDNHM